MYLLSFSLDNLSLMALTISTGFVVDDAIVMIENIARYIEDGEEPLAAALKGSEQIGFTIISLTVSLLAVLIPLLFMGDVVGRLFHEFAITLAVTIVISAVVSLTLVPMLCAKLLRHRPDDKRGWFDKGSRGCHRRHNRLLRTHVAHRAGPPAVDAAGGVLDAGAHCLPVHRHPERVLSDAGYRRIQGVTEAAQSISFSAMATKQQLLADKILENPDVENVESFVGVDANNTTQNSGRILISLKPLDVRKRSVAAIIRDLRAAVASVAGITLYMQPVQDLTIDSTVTRAQYHLVIENPSQQTLAEWTPKFVEKLRERPEVANVASDLANQGKRSTS